MPKLVVSAGLVCGNLLSTFKLSFPSVTFGLTTGAAVAGLFVGTVVLAPATVLPATALAFALGLGFPEEPMASFFDFVSSVGFHENPFKTRSYAMVFSGFKAPSIPFI